MKSSRLSKSLLRCSSATLSKSNHFIPQILLTISLLLLLFSITAASTIDDSELSELLRQDANAAKAALADSKVSGANAPRPGGAAG